MPSSAARRPPPARLALPAPPEASEATAVAKNENDEDNVQGTHAEKCVLRGKGLHEATLRQASYFWIEACDQNGHKRTTGGDTFCVALRGPSQCRARVTDHLDGTYMVVWKPNVSGTYSISISLSGDLLPGAPFEVKATTTQPSASKCSVSGDALNFAVSRVSQTFEIMFRDRLGQTASAVDLDMFVEPIPPTSPRSRATAKAKPSDPGGKSGETTRSRTIRVKVKEKPLIVRAGFAKDTEQVGVLFPGQVVTVVEERLPEPGEVRACVTLDSVALDIDGVGAHKDDETSTMGSQHDVVSTSPKLVSSPLRLDNRTTNGSPGQVGWITLVKAGKKLVSSRIKLGPGSRRLYSGQWTRRQLNDKVESLSGQMAKTVVNELTSDPTGIGFGFGGVEPGNSQGKLHDVHKVSYSIGRAGHYLLHVRLRQQAMAVAGSPFHLHVIPGQAHATGTQLSTQPLRGNVGTTDDAGCKMTMHAADRVGNSCTCGGAKVQIMCESSDMVTKVTDNEDGTYLLRWKSKKSGTFKTRVLIDGFDTIGSPRDVTLISMKPITKKSKVMGDGLKAAVVGKVSTLRIAFFDEYDNAALPGPKFKIGMALVNGKEKLPNVKQHVRNHKDRNIAGTRL